MNINRILFFSIFIFCSFITEAQQLYWVFFTDKDYAAAFDPYEYFDDKAIDRRIRSGLPLFDEKDLPVNEKYIEKLESAGGIEEGRSRWLNAAVILGTPNMAEQWQKFSFVKEIRSEGMNMTVAEITDKEIFGEKISRRDSALLVFQTKRMEAEKFWKTDITGKGVRVAIFDAGFPNVNDHPAFEHIRKENRIIKTYDFIKRQENVYHSSSHGTAVLSCIGGKYGEINIGLATGAEFLLARTEKIISENIKDELHWIQAAEWADKNGADIINSSLAYTYNRYFPEEMTGRVSHISKAANIAASKGILVINAAGNEGNNRWRTVGAPADADSVLTIGGVDPYTDAAIGFSSFGPSADYKRKPNVSAIGLVIAAGTSGYKRTQGTSFASPLVAGFAACTWQAYPQMNNMEIFNVIESAGHLYPYYDYVHGYGIPLASKIISDTTAPIPPTFEFKKEGNMVHIVIDDQFFPDDSSATMPVMNLYYNISNDDGRIMKYGVITVEEEEPLEVNLYQWDNSVIWVHFEGYTDRYPRPGNDNFESSPKIEEKIKHE